MSLSRLSLDRSPPLGVPVRFFLTAPLFGVAAAIGLLVSGPAVLQDRWSPESLALTHLLTLGFVTMVMSGALLQMPAVLAGSTVPRPRLVSGLLHPLLAGGTLLLAAALWLERASWVWPALGLLVPALLLLAGMGGYCLLRSSAAHASVRGMRLALAALLVVLLLGVLLAAGHGAAGFPLRREWTALHIAWGLPGWISLLVIAVAYQVVPMFQMTADYPRGLTRHLLPALFLMLCLWTAARLAAPSRAEPLAAAVAAMIVAGLVLFALATLWLQWRRRRRLADATLRYWRLAMISLLACGALWPVLESATGDRRLPVLAGLIFLAGFAASVISGMLYKIVPFLVWLHMQRMRHEQGRAAAAPPTMKEIIPERRALIQYRMYCGALVLLCLAVWWPVPWTRPAGLALAAAWLLLWINLLRALLCYRRLAC